MYRQISPSLSKHYRSRVDHRLGGVYVYSYKSVIISFASYFPLHSSARSYMITRMRFSYYNVRAVIST